MVGRINVTMSNGWRYPERLGNSLVTNIEKRHFHIILLTIIVVIKLCFTNYSTVRNLLQMY